VQGDRTTISGLQPGDLYCFQVRAVNSSGAGRRSPRACQRTVATEGSDVGPVYKVLTYNLCSRVCPGWAGRRDDAAALVARRHPDVVMLTEAVEDSGMAGAVGESMRQLIHHSGKALLYRTDRFRVANRDGEERTGFLDLGSDRFAVWAELVDKESEQHVLFVGVHLSMGKDTQAADAQRGQDATHLVAGIHRINPAGLPVVVAGDFNSYEQRRYDSPGAVMRSAGFANSFWRAHSWVRGNYNSANHGSAVPEISNNWGRHIDQVWAPPGQTQVLRWRNAARIKHGRYVPLPSNHNPVVVRLRVNW
jgi:endonuclease/exonuclease/phosphatase family metal-dependent hydrolase